MRDDVTIVYYTSNREDEKFESRIRKQLIESAGGLPIISVSQKPLTDCGKNICVGEQSCCNITLLKQILIGLKAAKTKYVLAAESDAVYPPEYFTFTPPTDDDVYVYSNVYIYYTRNNRRRGLNSQFWKKRFTEGALMCNRKTWIKLIEKALEGIDGWDNDLAHKPKFFFTKDKYSWTSPSPVVSIKTGKGLRKNTAVSLKHKPLDKLPYWGTVEDFKWKVFGSKKYG